MDLSFLKSNRFWALVIGCFGIAAQEDFTVAAWLKALEVFVGGFIGIRTIDRATETIAVGNASK
jgi:hypothetical protein